MNFTDTFQTVFDMVSSHTRIGFLTYRQRWELMISLLLGHPPIRGGNRPRDYPMGPQHKFPLQLAGMLGEMRIPLKLKSNEVQLEPPLTGPMVVPLYDWVVALALIAQHRVLEVEETHQRAFYWLLLNELIKGFEDALGSLESPMSGTQFGKTSRMLLAIKSDNRQNRTWRPNIFLKKIYNPREDDTKSEKKRYINQGRTT